MQNPSIGRMSKITSYAAAIALIGLGAVQTQAQSVDFNFSDGTSDGWQNSVFQNSQAAPIQNIGGINYIYLSPGNFLSGAVSSGPPGVLPTFYATMAAAAANPAGYDISYDYYINTAGFNSGETFLQLGTFVISDNGYYAGDFGIPNEIQLSGTQMASGQIFQGQVTINMAAVGFDIPAANTFFELGLIVNSDGTSGGVDFTNISVYPVPEPSSFGYYGLGLAAGSAVLPSLRRRKA
jgi:hypothetical protein